MAAVERPVGMACPSTSSRRFDMWGEAGGGGEWGQAEACTTGESLGCSAGGGLHFDDVVGDASLHAGGGDADSWARWRSWTRLGHRGSRVRIEVRPPGCSGTTSTGVRASLRASVPSVATFRGVPAAV